MEPKKSFSKEPNSVFHDHLERVFGKELKDVEVPFLFVNIEDLEKISTSMQDAMSEILTI